MVVKDLKKGTMFFIVSSSDSKWISNEKSEKLLGLEFNRISSWNFNLNEIWTRYLYLHLVSNSTQVKEFEVSN
jgi:hypothetical protein